MSTITVILEADADGTVHLPVPAELRHGRIAVTATLEAVGGGAVTVGALDPSMLEAVRRRKVALQGLRDEGGLGDVIGDAAEWQRDARQDRRLPGRD